MIQSLPLFDRLFEQGESNRSVPVGERRKQDGMDRVLFGLSDEYRIKFCAVVEGLPKGHEFTVENITEIVGRPPEGKSNAVGALISGCGRRGLIRRTGRMIKAKRPSSNSTELSEWIRL